MFPTPAIRFWSSRNALIGARGAARERRRCAVVNAVVERLDAEPGGEERLQRRRGRAPARRCRSAAGRRSAARGRRRGRSARGVCAGAPSGSSSSVPVMRRCMSRKTSSASSQTRYLPRRPRRSTRAPLDAPRRARGASSGRHQRGSSDLERVQRPALDVRREVRGGSSRPRGARARRPRLGAAQAAPDRRSSSASEVPSTRSTAASTVPGSPAAPRTASRLKAS